MPLAKARDGADHARFDAVETMMGEGSARIALAHAAIDPCDARFAARPSEKWIDADRQGEAAAVLPMMNDKRRRQSRRRSHAGALRW